MICWKTGGNLRSAMLGIFVFSFRSTIAKEPFCLKMFTRNRASPSTEYEQSHEPVFFKSSSNRCDVPTMVRASPSVCCGWNPALNCVPSTGMSLPKFSTCGGRPTTKNKSLTPSPSESILRSRSSMGSGCELKTGPAAPMPLVDTVTAATCAGVGAWTGGAACNGACTGAGATRGAATGISNGMSAGAGSSISGSSSIAPKSNAISGPLWARGAVGARCPLIVRGRGGAPVAVEGLIRPESS